MGRLDGSCSLITAAGAGIGRAAALAFVREGARVIATDIDERALAELKALNPAIEIARLDVTNEDDVVAGAKRWPRVDALFNVAGWVPNGTILECDGNQWNRAIDINVSSMYRTARAFLPAMLSRGTGVILNMSSVASSVKAVPNRFAYSTTKAAVIGLTKAIAVDFVGHGIRCNAICPGTIDTPSLADRLAATGDPDGARAAFVARQPMGRLGTPEEVAELAVHLASREAAFTTGQAYIIDGGWAA